MDLGLEIFGLASLRLALGELRSINLVIRLLTLSQFNRIIRMLVFFLLFGLSLTFLLLILFMGGLGLD